MEEILKIEVGTPLQEVLKDKFEAQEQLYKLLIKMRRELLEEVIDIITTHSEHRGEYCDTGEDMEWACRSDCMELAVKRLRERFNAVAR